MAEYATDENRNNEDRALGSPVSDNKSVENSLVKFGLISGSDRKSVRNSDSSAEFRSLCKILTVPVIMILLGLISGGLASWFKIQDPVR